MDTPESWKAAPLGAQNRKEQPNIYKRVVYKPILTVVKKMPTASVDPHITSATQRQVEDVSKSIRSVSSKLTPLALNHPDTADTWIRPAAVGGQLGHGGKWPVSDRLIPSNAAFRFLPLFDGD